MPTPARILADHPDWPEAEAELRQVLEHMTMPEVARYILTRQAGSAVYSHALLAAVALELVNELVLTGEALDHAERETLALACYRLADSLTPS